MGLEKANSEKKLQAKRKLHGVGIRCGAVWCGSRIEIEKQGFFIFLGRRMNINYGIDETSAWWVDCMRRKKEVMDSITCLFIYVGSECCDAMPPDEGTKPERRIAFEI